MVGRRLSLRLARSPWAPPGFGLHSSSRRQGRAEEDQAVSKSQRDKGQRIEREIVALHEDIGCHAERVPLSGAARYKNDGHDVDVYAFGVAEGPLVAEVKGRKDGEGFRLLEKWLGDYDLLFLRRDRKRPLVVLPWATYQALIEKVQTWPPGIRRPPPGGISERPAVRGADVVELKEVKDGTQERQTADGRGPGIATGTARKA